MVSACAAQPTLDRGDLAIELVDHSRRGLDVSAPRLGDGEAIEQLAAAAAEQVGDRTGFAPGEQDRVDAVLEARAMLDQVKAPARPLTLFADRRVWKPDRRHQVASRELG